MTRLLVLLTLLLPVVALANPAANPATRILQLQTEDRQHIRLSSADLLARPDVATITIPRDAAYKREMTYKAVPLGKLLREKGFTARGTVTFLALDGYAAPIPTDKLLDETGPRPWLAVEDPTDPWPRLSPDGSAGPFYLVWLMAGKSDAPVTVPPEHWPFQIAVIKQTLMPEERFPQIKPDESLPKDFSAWQGLDVYKTHCIACHKINGGGDAIMGPDLNLPHNPTEYFAEEYLRKLIRDPAQVRTWVGMKMPGFSPEIMSDQELDALVVYLKSMVGRR